MRTAQKDEKEVRVVFTGIVRPGQRADLLNRGFTEQGDGSFVAPLGSNSWQTESALEEVGLRPDDFQVS